MSYLLNKTTGQLLINLVDGTADGPDINPGQNVSDLDLFGKNYPLYGQWLDENFIKLLQNFANATPPSKPLQGELWYNITTGFLNVYNGTSWVLVSPVLVSSSAPAANTFGSVVGTQWWDSINLQLNSWNGSSWTLIGPAYKATDGKSGSLVESVADTVGGTHTIIKFYNQNNVTAICSFDSTFTLSPANPVTGFTTINPGFTLATGVANEIVITGSATNAKMLGNVVAANYARTDITPTFASNILVGNGAISIDYVSSTGAARYYNTINGGNISLWPTVSGVSTRALAVSGADASTNVLYNLNVTGRTTIGGDVVVGGNLTIYGRTTGGVTGQGNIVLGFNPTLTGAPQAPTPAQGDVSTTIATTAFVNTAISTSTTGLWQGSYQFVSTVPPTNGVGNPGDFWFQI